MTAARSAAELVGHRFPGGGAVVERWEHALFHFATGVDAVPRHDRVHPACAFHVPIRSVGTSIAGLFELVGAEGPAGVGIDHYDFRFRSPWRVGDALQATGSIDSVESVTVSSRGVERPADRVTFEFTLAGDDGPVVVSRVAWWVFHPQREVDPAVPVVGQDPVPTPVEEAGVVSSHTVQDVSAAHMRLAAALFRDPYPIHWDVDASEAAGLGRRLVNQTPLNVAYVVDLLHDRHGIGSISALRLQFPGLVFAGDAVLASAWPSERGEVVALTRRGTVVLHGVAELRRGV